MNREQLIQENIDKDKALKAEPYCVVVKMQYMPHILRLTYSKQKGGTITQIEELDAAERIISSCKFRGKSHSGDCSEDIIDFKKLASQLKSTDWLGNDCWVDEYFQNH
jgi:hypothetical protein